MTEDELDRATELILAIENMDSQLEEMTYREKKKICDVMWWFALMVWWWLDILDMCVFGCCQQGSLSMFASFFKVSE